MKENSKLLKKLIKFLENDVEHKFEKIKLVNQGTLNDEGTYHEYNVCGYLFGCAFQKLTDDLKVNFYFHDTFLWDDTSFWQSKGYNFRLNLGHTSSEYWHTMALLRLKGIDPDKCIKVIINKLVESSYVFKRDFKYIVMMLRNRQHHNYIQSQLKKKYGDFYR